MPSPHDQDRTTLMLTLRASLLMLSFGTVLLALLVAIDRPHWFTLRPASGTAAAMSNASRPPATPPLRHSAQRTPSQPQESL